MSRFAFHHRNSEFEIWEYKPDAIHAFPFHMEPITRSWRIRCFLEYFVGYKVYYIKKENLWAGYCVISNGRNPRYRFSSSRDIIFGRYFIAESFRGDGLAVRMLNEVLNKCGLKYDTAFAYLRYKNIASRKTLSKLGAGDLYRFNINGMARRLRKEDEGEFILVSYKGAKG